MNMDVITKKIVQKLQVLGKKYGCGFTPGYRIESHHRFSCKFADGTTKEIIVVLREEDVSVFSRPNPPQWFEGSFNVEDVLKEIERLLQSSN
jgi:hypothetical protein